ncbi:MAG: hypothetical protein NVSMB52_13110 [Chloroflexota bacterium]
MKRLPGPPAIAASFSGFVVGVFVTLIATGILTRPSHTGAGVTLPPPKKVADSELSLRVRKLIVLQLGSLYPTHRLPRLVSLSLLPASPFPVPPDTSTAISKERSVYVVFRLNDHPLGKSWRFRAAKADVFGVMKALYTSNLPIYNVEMVGLFPVVQNRKTQVGQVVVAYMSHERANTIPWKKWGREAEARLWTLLTYKSLNPRFG